MTGSALSNQIAIDLKVKKRGGGGEQTIEEGENEIKFEEWADLFFNKFSGP
jgi:hypothetical protein